MLNLGYPGGPIVEQLALQGNPSRFAFRSGVVKNSPWSFSFSGIKTAVLYAIEGIDHEISLQDKADICASFQTAVFDDVSKKLTAACAELCHKALAMIAGLGYHVWKSKKPGFDIIEPKTRSEFYS